MITHLIIMLGVGEKEYDNLYRAFSHNPTMEVMRNCFEYIHLCLESNFYKTFVEEEYVKRLPGTSQFKARIIIHEIDGGTNIGGNRYQSFIKVKSWINKLPESYNSYVMFFDCDDYFINSNLWSKVIHDLRTLSRPPKLIEFNYISDQIEKVEFNSSEKYQENTSTRWISLDPWMMDSYDKIEGYKYYNPKIRVSGYQKLFEVNLIDPTMFNRSVRYEDSLIFAKALAKLDIVGMVPMASIVYNRESSSVLTKDSVHDEELKEIKRLLFFGGKLSNFSWEGSIVPAIALYNQISKWTNNKKNE